MVKLLRQEPYVAETTLAYSSSEQRSLFPEEQLHNERSFTVGKRTIYQAQSQDLLALFEDAGHPEKVMCVAMDYAKATHTALPCNGMGEYLRKPFPVYNSQKGIDFLVERIRAACKRHGIQSKHVFFGGEDVPTYAVNFIHALRSRGWIVASVNSFDAKKQRENMQASSDILDLLGIAKMLLSRRGNASPAQTGIYLNLRNLVRHRRQLVHMRTEISNRTHTLVDQLFPGFLDEKKSGIVPFSDGSLWLMEQRFSARQIRRRRSDGLVHGLQRCGTPRADQAVAKLKGLADQVLAPASEYIETLQMSLSQQVALYRCLSQNIDQSVHEMALLLAQTPAALLTTVRSIAIVLASGVVAELGDPHAQRPVNNLCSYAGIVPRSKQTGGPEQDPKIGRVGRRANRILKDYLVQSGSMIGRLGPADLMADHHRRQSTGQHADFGIARRYLRLGMCLMRTGQIYLPPELRTEKATAEQRAAYYLKLWPKLRKKWRDVKADHVAFDPRNPLGQWRNMVEEFYGVKLPLIRSTGNGGGKRNR
jgi:transposase